MNLTKSQSRRRFLQVAGMGTAGTVVAACGIGSKPPADSSGSPVPGQPPGTQPAPSNFKADLEINLRATPGEQAIFPGAKTRVWRYQAEVVGGDPEVVGLVPDSYLGPVLRLQRGQKVRVNFTNDLPEPSIVHWHGLHLPNRADGQPQQVVGSGGTYLYKFEVDNRAGTYWFHPHPDGRTAYQAYQGLAGLILVSDDEESGLGLPAGEFDLPLVLQDRIVDEQNQWFYPANAMMARMTGVLGDQILVNGNPDVILPVAATAYRLRFLNGSNMRTYKLAWEDGASWTVIATDGGLLERPVQRPYICLSPGERVEVWVDFSSRPVGSQLRLVSQAFSGGTMQMMGGMMGGGMSGGAMGGTSMPGGMMGGMDMRGMMGGMNNSLPNGAEFTVLTVKIDHAGPQPTGLPEKLSALERLSEADAVNAANPRTFTLGFMRGMWTINGRMFQMNEVAEDEIVKLDTTEAWVFDNTGMMGMMMNEMMGGMMGGAMPGGMMGGTPVPGGTSGSPMPGGMMGGTPMPGGAMSVTAMPGGSMGGTPMPGGMMGATPMPGGMMDMPHTMHLHGLQFLILDRQVDPQFQAEWKTIQDGLVDEGWKDTFLVMPGEQVKLLMRFTDYTGLFLYHCHNLEHEDLGMMRYYRVDA